jgi:hypothetical protein
VSRASPGEADDHDGQGGGKEQLEETLPSVLGIGQAGGLQDVVVALEQHHQLDDAEGQEQGVQQPEHRQPLHAAEPESDSVELADQTGEPTGRAPNGGQNEGPCDDGDE